MYCRGLIQMNKILKTKFRNNFQSWFGNYYGLTSKAFVSSGSHQIKLGPGLHDFIQQTRKNDRISVLAADKTPIPYIEQSELQGGQRKIYFDVHGCQMNVNDVEIAWAILEGMNYSRTNDITEADVLLIMTCSIRENAEEKIWNKLSNYKSLKKKRRLSPHLPSLKIGILGCMAERLKLKLLEKSEIVDLVAGPDSYKDLPRLLAITRNDQTAINVLLSHDETYADVLPVRLNQDAVTAFVSIMRGCDNMCTYCIVPFTRGKERSRPISSIIKEVELLYSQGVREVTLLGQNVNSYRDVNECADGKVTSLVQGFKTVYKHKKGGLRFADLLHRVATAVPGIRIRFSSPHPKDFPDEVLYAIKQYKNVCCSLHIPAQSGSTTVLDRMRRGYSRESYLDLIDHVRELLPNVTLSSDFICGFCGETDEEFNDTITLMEKVKYNVAYLFAYSMREKTTAHRRYVDDIPPEIKQKRLIKMQQVFREGASQSNEVFEKTQQTILVEGKSRRSEKKLQGRIDGNIKVIVPAYDVPISQYSSELKPILPGNFINVSITESNSQVLKGVPLHHTTME